MAGRRNRPIAATRLLLLCKDIILKEFKRFHDTVGVNAGADYLL